MVWLYKSLKMFLGKNFADKKKHITALQREQKQMDVSKDEVYQEYVSGRITPEEYRARADELNRQTELLSGQLHERQEKLFVLEEEQEKLKADMKQIIRYSHMEGLTQELVDTFIEKIYVYKDKRVEIKWKFREFPVRTENQKTNGGEADGK